MIVFKVVYFLSFVAPAQEEDKLLNKGKGGLWLGLSHYSFNRLSVVRSKGQSF